MKMKELKFLKNVVMPMVLNDSAVCDLLLNYDTTKSELIPKYANYLTFKNIITEDTSITECKISKYLYHDYKFIFKSEIPYATSNYPFVLFAQAIYDSMRKYLIVKTMGKIRNIRSFDKVMYKYGKKLMLLDYSPETNYGLINKLITSSKSTIIFSEKILLSTDYKELRYLDNKEIAIIDYNYSRVIYHIPIQELVNGFKEWKRILVFPLSNYADSMFDCNRYLSTIPSASVNYIKSMVSQLPIGLKNMFYDNLEYYIKNESEILSELDNWFKDKKDSLSYSFFPLYIKLLFGEIAKKIKKEKGEN